MDRREALAAASVLFGGAIVGGPAFLAGCSTRDRKTPFVGLLSAEDVALLDEVGETILPLTPDSAGAKAAGIGEFMNVIVTDCYSPEEQQVFIAGLPALKAEARERYGTGFTDLSAEQRLEFLLSLEAEAARGDSPGSTAPPERHYYGMIKQLTVWGYFTSEAGATQALRYVAVPGRYDGCVPYVEGETAWAPV
jgi:hypothetical protein